MKTAQTVTRIIAAIIISLGVSQQAIASCFLGILGDCEKPPSKGPCILGTFGDCEKSPPKIELPLPPVLPHAYFSDKPVPAFQEVKNDTCPNTTGRAKYCNISLSSDAEVSGPVSQFSDFVLSEASNKKIYTGCPIISVKMTVPAKHKLACHIEGEMYTVAVKWHDPRGHSKTYGNHTVNGFLWTPKREAHCVPVPL